MIMMIMMIAEKISLILILFVAFFVVSSGLFLILHIVFKNLQEKRNKDLLGKMPNYMAICACILAQIIAIGLMVFLILKTFEVGKNIPQPNAINQQRTNSEFDHLKGEELFQAIEQKYKNQKKMEAQDQDINTKKKPVKYWTRKQFYEYLEQKKANTQNQDINAEKKVGKFDHMTNEEVVQYFKQRDKKPQ